MNALNFYTQLSVILGRFIRNLYPKRTIWEHKTYKDHTDLCLKHLNRWYLGKWLN